MMLGIAGRPESKDGKSLEPMEGHGLQAISIGFLIDIDTPMVWRGPMVTQALEQLLQGHALARARLPDRRPAAGHRRHPAHAGAEGAGDRRGDRHHAAGHRAASTRARASRCSRRSASRSSASSRTWRSTSARSAATRATSSARAARRACRKDYGTELLGQLPLDGSDPRAGRFGQADGRCPIRTDRSPRSTRQIARRCAVQDRRVAEGHDLEVPEHRGAEHLSSVSSARPSPERQGLLDGAQRLEEHAPRSDSARWRRACRRLDVASTPRSR